MTSDLLGTAVVVVDVQADFIEVDGYFGRAGFELDGVRRILGPLNGFLSQARAAEMLVIYLEYTQLEDGRSMSAAHRRALYSDETGDPYYCLAGTPGHRIVADVKPHPSDIVIQKLRGSGFRGTSLELILSSNCISNLVISGLVTEGCVLNTAVEATNRDYYVYLPPDLCGSYSDESHNAALTALARTTTQIPSQDLIPFLSRRSHSSAD